MSFKRKLIDTTIISVASRIGYIGELVGYVFRNLEYDRLKRIFIQNGKDSSWNSDLRKDIIRRFEIIDKHIPIATSKTDGLFLAEAILSLNVDGAIVECGCYSGGSTAKLSILSKILNKKLYVLDSFEGLPEVDQYNIRDFHARNSSKWVTDWTAGRYSSDLDQVKSNVEKFGEISVCKFHKGWFNDTLNDNNLPSKICCSFVDVDIPSSARECFVALWPRTEARGIYFSHDIAYIKVLQAIFDQKLWHSVFREFPPIIFGAGYGLGDYSPHLGFMVKGESLSAEYINSLTLEK